MKPETTKQMRFIIDQFMASDKKMDGAFCTMRIPVTVIEQARSLLNTVDENGYYSYVFYFLDGTHELMKGPSPDKAFSASGYSAGATRTIDFFEEGSTPSYTWDKTKRNWEKNKE